MNLLDALYRSGVVRRRDGGTELVGIGQLMDRLSLASLPRVQRAVLVGTALSPNEIWMRGGVETRTLWAELAWQLLGADGYRMLEKSDQLRRRLA